MGSKANTAGRKRKDKYSITFYRAWCKECGICGEFCPTHAIVCDDLGRPQAASADACINCHTCEYRCPDFAVTIHRRNEPPADTPMDVAEAPVPETSPEPKG